MLMHARFCAGNWLHTGCCLCLSGWRLYCWIIVLKMLPRKMNKKKHLWMGLKKYILVAYIKLRWKNVDRVNYYGVPKALMDCFSALIHAHFFRVLRLLQSTTTLRQLMFFLKHFGAVIIADLRYNYCSIWAFKCDRLENRRSSCRAAIMTAVWVDSLGHRQHVRFGLLTVCHAQVHRHIIIVIEENIASLSVRHGKIVVGTMRRVERLIVVALVKEHKRRIL